MDYSALASDDLVRTCLGSRDEQAWAEFIRRFQPLIAGVVLRVSRKWGQDAPQVVDDLIQETYLKLCVDRGRLRTFESAHPDAIYSYLKVFTANLVRDYFKSLRSMRSGGTSVKVSVDADEHGALALGTERPRELLEREVLLREIDAYLRTTLAGPHALRDRKIFWLYYRSGLTACAISALPGIELTTKGIETVILRLTREVRSHFCRQSAVLGPSPPEGIEAKDSF